MTAHVAFDCGACVPEESAIRHAITCTLCHDIRSHS